MGKQSKASNQPVDIVVEEDSVRAVHAYHTQPGAPAGHTLTSQDPQVTHDSPCVPATLDLVGSGQTGTSTATFCPSVPCVSNLPEASALRAAKFPYSSFPEESRPPLLQPQEAPAMTSSSYPAPVDTCTHEAPSSPTAVPASDAADAVPGLAVGTYMKAPTYTAGSEGINPGPQTCQHVDLEACRAGEQMSPMARRLHKPTSIIPSVILLVLIIIELVLVFLNYDRTSGKVTPNIAMYIIAGVFGVVYLAWYTPEWICSSTHKALCNQQQENSLFKYVDTLRKTRPTLTMHVQCWHDEIKFRTVRDASGNVRMEPYNVTITTHQRSEPYYFTSWSDRTSAVPTLVRSEMTKVHLTAGYSFENQAAQAKFDCAMQDFQSRTPWDRRMNFWTTFAVPGFKEHVLCDVDMSGSPGWVRNLWFRAASILCCSLPYRMLLDYHSVSYKHEIRKCIGI